MNPMQLRETTLDPNTRRLVQLVISDEDEQQTTAPDSIVMVEQWESCLLYTSHDIRRRHHIIVVLVVSDVDRVTIACLLYTSGSAGRCAPTARSRSILKG